MNTLRHPLFNLLLGTLFGVGIGAAVASHVAAVHADQQVSEESKRLLDLNKRWNGIVETQSARADACETKLANAADTAARAQFAKDLDASWYTLLYEPALPAETADHSMPNTAALWNTSGPAEIWCGQDAVRCWSKAARKPPAAAGAPRTQLRWVLQGYVNPVVIPDGWHAVYTRDAGHALSAANGVQ